MTFWIVFKIKVLFLLLNFLLSSEHRPPSPSSPSSPRSPSPSPDDGDNGSPPEASIARCDFFKGLTQLSALGDQERGDDIDDFLDELEASHERCGPSFSPFATLSWQNFVVSFLFFFLFRAAMIPSLIPSLPRGVWSLQSPSQKVQAPTFWRRIPKMPRC